MTSLTRWSSAMVALAASASWTVARADGAAPLADDPTLVALAVALSCADAPEGAAAPAGDGAAKPAPEVELVATVRARSLVFDEVPKVDDVLGGKGAGRLSWKAERVNLPPHPDAGFVYRDVVVRVTVSGAADDLAALLAGAKRAARGLRIEGDSPPAPVAEVKAPGGPKIVEVSATPAPTAPATPASSATAAPTPTPTTAPPTAPPTATPKPTAAPAPAPTPTATAIATPTVAPAATPIPTATPDLAETLPPPPPPPSAAP